MIPQEQSKLCDEVIHLGCLVMQGKATLEQTNEFLLKYGLLSLLPKE